MSIKNGREQRMLNAAKELVKEYLLDDIWNYDTNIKAVAEMLWDEFQVQNAVADKLAKKLVDSFWNDIVAEVECEIDENREYEAERREAMKGAY